MTTHISKHFMSIQCVHSEFLHLTHHSTCTWQRPALQCLALPISAPQRVLSPALGVQSSQNQLSQPMGIPAIPQEGFTLDTADGINEKTG